MVVPAAPGSPSEDKLVPDEQPDLKKKKIHTHTQAHAHAHASQRLHLNLQFFHGFKF